MSVLMYICLSIIGLCTVAIIISSIHTLFIYHKVDKEYEKLDKEYEKLSKKHEERMSRNEQSNRK